MSEQYTISHHFAVAIINDDRTGLTDEEDDQLDAWVEQIHAGRPGYFTYYTSEPEFQADEITGLMADCIAIDFNEIQGAAA